MLNWMNRAIATTPRQWGQGALLVTLHVVLILGPGDLWTDALMMMHFGLFLLWQPIWRGEQRLTLASSVMFVAGAAILLALISWWLMAFWLAVLSGLLGGRVFSARVRGERIANLVALGYLLAMLLLWVEPHLLKLEVMVSNVHDLVFYILPVVPVSLLFMRENRRQGPAISLDFFYGLLVFLLVVVLLLGSFVIQTVTRLDYALVLMRSVFAMSAILLVLSWLWNPRAGFAGIGQLLSRYLMSVGMPFEVWLQQVAVLAETSSTASAFLGAATEEVAKLPWVIGGVWQAESSSGTFGQSSPFSASFTYHGLRLTLFTRTAMSPALTLHVKLLTQLLGEFYEAKQREEQMRNTAYLQAVYETGARMTHDIKNLLQSLNTLCSAVDQKENADPERLVALVQRQLPQLTQRLHVTLDKLQSPEQEQPALTNATTWWNQLRQRYKQFNVEFESERIPAGTELPSLLFDSVVENLLQNSIEKRRLQPDLRIKVVLTTKDEVSLYVMDDGKPVDPEISAKLLKMPVPSASGLGIGLFQAARLATQQGYTLALKKNVEGEVRFGLMPNLQRVGRAASA